MPKALIVFWAVVAGVTLTGIAVLQYLGPPPAPHPVAATVPPAKTPVAPAPPRAPAAPVLPGVTVTRLMGTGSQLPPGAPIPAPLPALLAAAPSNPNWLVPRIGPNGLAPMRAYAATVPPASGPRLAVLVAGVGNDNTISQNAVDQLPAAISLAITPYGQHIGAIAALARAAGHEILLALPMQELDPATENAGNKALVVAGPITLNQPLLDWNMAQIQAYAGVTDAIGVTQGAGFMNNGNARFWLLREIADRGLFFIDTRNAGPQPYAWSRSADIVIDAVNTPQYEATQLVDLAALAKSQNTALGILLNPTANALDMLSIWSSSLPAEGITLVPVSALVLPPNPPVTEAAVSP